MKINTQRNHRIRHSTHEVPAVFMSTVMLCLVLLSACSANSGNTVSSPPTAAPSPTINPTSKNQGDMQLLAFQQWITLMQQSNGDTTTFQQQYDADQQALNDA